MAFEAYIKTKGVTQGNFPGTTPQVDKDVGINQADWSNVLNVDYHVLAKVNKTDGTPSGGRMHEPLRVTMEIDANAARYFQSLTTGESLTVELVMAQQKKVKPGEGNPAGRQKAVTIKLENAHVTGFRFASGDPQLGSSPSSHDRAVHDTIELVQIQFQFQKITMDSSPDDGHVVASDDWYKPHQVTT